ncbi:MAG TPA: hypothetical protein VEQ41_04765, partial [Solirubrobacterales bacterium]|nr:hypothetical protein [Solirubrobacterales bacterium]
LLALGAGLGAESINMAGALRAGDGQLDEALARSLFEVSQMLGSAAAAVGIGVFSVATAVVALRARAVLPRWLAVATLLVGISLFTPLGHTLEWPGGAMILVTAAVSVSLLRDPDSSKSPSAPPGPPPR